MENWFMHMKKADFKALSEQLHITPVTARLLRNRDLTDVSSMQKFLHGDLQSLHDPRDMKDMEKACKILQKKIDGKSRIRVIGDYDIDGVSAVYILLRGLKLCGAQVDYDIPDRMKDGYGMNVSMIEHAREDGIDTILTCDNGIAAREAIERAKAYGMTVVVTDHHQVPYEDTDTGRSFVLPPADAVVDPHREDCTYPYKDICGAVVAWKLVQALCANMGKDPVQIEDLIEIAAIATVGDVMDLRDENRIIVKEGLKRLCNTQNAGLKALIRTCGLEGQSLTAYHVGFVIGPCINATGRLDSAKRALKLLSTENPREAAEYAADLKALNDSRKEMTDQNVEKAIRLIDSSDLQNDRVLVVYLPECHESLAGIIAGRLRERYYRPTIVLTRGESFVKGSGRSIEEYSMFEELSSCKELLVKFGGHPMAAGLSLTEENVEPLRKSLNACCTLTEQQLIPKVSLDMVLPFYYADEKQIREIEQLAPFGKGNERPIFALKNVRVSNVRMKGKSGKACGMILEDEYGVRAEGIYFGEAAAFAEAAKRQPVMDIAYYPEINEFRGIRTLQMTVKYYR